MGNLIKELAERCIEPFKVLLNYWVYIAAVLLIGLFYYLVLR